MDKNLSILLIEDDPIECQDIAEYVKKNKNITLIGITNNILKAMEYVKYSLPDVIILDLELHKGYGNGLEFLSMLQKDKPSIPIYILVTTNNISNITHDCVRKMGGDFIMLKSQEDYSGKSAIDFLLSIRNIIQNNKIVLTQKDELENSLDITKRITKKIIYEFDKIGIPPNAIGRKYLMDSILLIIDDKTEKIYKSVSQKYTKTEASVERAMQNAIEKAWKTTHIDD